MDMILRFKTLYMLAFFLFNQLSLIYFFFILYYIYVCVYIYVCACAYIYVFVSMYIFGFARSFF